MRLFRFCRILMIASRYGLDSMVFDLEPSGKLVRFINAVQFWRDLSAPRAARLRQALEDLGPIFVKFGQVLSTRRDLLPTDIADELARLQDQVPPFDSELAVQEIEKAYGRPLKEIFSRFDTLPAASASIAQVHFARLPDGREVAVKILRPGMKKVIDHDLALMETAAALLEKVWPDGRRLRPKEVVEEFAKYLNDELDLIREAANCSQLRRNFETSGLLMVPEVFWDYCRPTVMVMERMYGVPISHLDELRKMGVDLKKLSKAGVEIFFTQVFRDGFFHADMHPGNIFVHETGRYIALDFGIVGTIAESDKNYLAQNFLAFFRRDYRRVAEAHIESGWVPQKTRADEFESAIRALCEPIFNRPLKEISFGKVLLRLFQTGRRFGVQIQPQLLMLQKTLLNIEGLGRQLDPDLDLWETAQPFLERWMSQQLGWRGAVSSLQEEAPRWARTLPQLPRLVYQALEKRPSLQVEIQMERLIAAQEKQNRRLFVLIVLILVFLASFAGFAFPGLFMG